MKDHLTHIIAIAMISSLSVPAFGQCPSAGTLFSSQTISSDCTVSGNLTIQGPTLTIDPGVTLTVTGNLTIQGEVIISASSTSIINVGGNLVDAWVGSIKNTISGGTYNITGDIRETSGGGFEINNAIMYADSMATSGGSTLDIVNGSEVYITRGTRSNERLNIDASKLDIGGALEVTGGDAVTVSGGGELIVRGDFSFNGSGGGGTVLSVETGGLVRIFGDVDSSTGGNSISVDDDSGISVDGEFVGSSAPSVTVGSGDDGSDCLSGGGCCGDATACGSATVLPVTLVDFTHSVGKNTVILSWRTASEQNNDHFTLERSLDGINYLEICEIPGAGTVNELRQYSHSDRLFVQDERLYYRLSQTDFDGTHKVLGIVSADAPLFESPLKVFPNPVINEENIQLLGILDGTHWQLFSLAGELMRSGFLDASSEVSVKGLRSGTWLIKTENATAVFIIK